MIKLLVLIHLFADDTENQSNDLQNYIARLDKCSARWKPIFNVEKM